MLLFFHWINVQWCIIVCLICIFLYEILTLFSVKLILIYNNEIIKVFNIFQICNLHKTIFTLKIMVFLKFNITRVLLIKSKELLKKHFFNHCLQSNWLCKEIVNILYSLQGCSINRSSNVSMTLLSLGLSFCNLKKCKWFKKYTFIY